MNIKDKILNIFFVEEKNNYFDLFYNKLRIWELIRVEIYLLLSGEYATFKKKKKNIKSILILFMNSLDIFNMNLFSRSEIIIIESTRYMKIRDSFLDIYTVQIKNKYIDAKVLQTISSVEQRKARKNNTYNIQLINILIRIISKLFASCSINSALKKIVFKLLSEFDALELRKIVINKYYFTIVSIKVYRAYFKIVKPKQIFIVGNNSKEGLIYAAKQLNIDVVEIQHGILNKICLIYSYPEKIKGILQFFPTKFLYYNFFLKMTKYLPLSSENIIESDMTYHTWVSNVYFDEYKRKKNTIAFISQPTIFKKLMDVIIDNLDDLRDFKVFIRLHPNDILDEGESVIFAKYDNIYISQKETNFFEFVSKINHCVGVYSTALIDAIKFGCNIYLLNIEGIENFSEYLDKFTIISPVNIKSQLIV